MPASLATCNATWNQGVLTLENPLFRREYVWSNGQLHPLSFVAFEREWIAPQAEIEPDATNLPQFSVAKTDGSPVGAPRLEVRLENDEVCYEFRVWRGIAGCAFRVLRRTYREVAARQQRELTGIEVEVPEAQAIGAGDDGVLERFELATRHLRLRAPRLQDRTDNRTELVHEDQWLLSPRELAISLNSNVFALESVLQDDGLLFFRHTPEPLSSLDPLLTFSLHRGRQLALYDGEKWCATIAFSGALVGRCRAIQNYSRAWREHDDARDGLFLSNTWGDRGRDAHLSPEFMAREIEAAARLGVDVVQIDDGWQKGTTANSALAKQRGGVWNGFWASDPQFWNVNKERFPEGLQPLIESAKSKGLQLGLWFAPDSSDDLNNWQRDADAILRLHRDFGVNYFKIDALKLDSPRAEANARRFFARVLKESNGRVTFDLDITAERRFGYLGLLEPGPLFVENRYTDWGHYFPHHTLRALWQLSHWVEPTRLRLEWLNHARNEDKYEGDPLAPSQWSPDALFATIMLASPLGWFEVQNLPDSYFQTAAPLVQIWKQHRAELRRGVVVPIGDAPDGVSWTGFAVVGETKSFALIFREKSEAAHATFELPLDSPHKTTVLAGDGRAEVNGTRLSVQIDQPFGFLWAMFE